MNIQIPSVAAIQAELDAMSHASVQELSRVSSVPFTTIWKIKDGTTRNPGIDTVIKFWPYMDAARNAVANKAVADA